MSTVILNADSHMNMKLIVELAKKLDIDVCSISKKEIEEIEEIEDLKLLHRMVAAREEGFADRTETLKRLGL